MDTFILKEKDQRILKLIVEAYLESGRPVSSGEIFRKKRFPGSPATLRNVMVRLEEKGYLSQPHTSAGRVPTDRGLRFYVNSLLADALFPRDETTLVPEDLAAKGSDLDSLLSEVSRLLAVHSDNLGFVISPRLSQIPFRHLRFMKVAEDKVMAILVTPFQMVLTQIVESRSQFTQVELDRAAQYVNLNFRGKNLLFIRDFLFRELPKYRLKYEDIIQKLSGLVRTYVSQEAANSRIILQGTSRLLNKAELFGGGRLEALFQSFEEKANLARLLSDLISLDRVKVLIGSEVDSPDIKDCSLILSHYGTGNQVLGSLGIIGPKRIPYDKIIPLVDSVAKRLSRAIMSTGQEVSL
jgi:heat-inducible transcriptional repressor